MQQKAPSTPLILWICAAVCAHYMFAQGGGVVAEVHDDHNFISALGMHARGITQAGEQIFSIESIGEDTPKSEENVVLKEPEKKKEEKKVDEKKPEEKKPEEKKKEEKVAIVEQAKKPPVQPKIESRIAVRQHQKTEEDNPDAKFIADEANKVTEESVATQTAHDQDDPNPTPGGNHAGDKNRTGDSDRTKIADSEDRAGAKDRGPGSKTTELEVPNEIPKPAQKVAQATPSADPARSGGDGKSAPLAQANPALAPGGAGPQAQDMSGAESGTWSFNPFSKGAGQTPDTALGQAAKDPQKNGNQTAWLGLGGNPGPGQINLNLSHTGVVAVVGNEQLNHDRVADGERRRSEHRGAWVASNFERWRSAIENYVTSVKPGNQTALNAARVPFASYLTNMHNRIHPIFAESFLGSLDGLPPSHPLNNQKLITRLEIILSKDGKLVKMGVAKASGVTSFDVAALDAVERASPFGPAPQAIVSTDGRVYLHWEFHRDEVFACSTRNASPFMLNVPAGATPPAPEAPPQKPTKPGDDQLPPQSPADLRHGVLRGEAYPRSL